MQVGRRRWLVAVVCMLAPALATHATPASAAGTVREILTVGDSLTFGSLPHQTPAYIRAGWTSSHVSAYGSRGIATKVANDPYTGLTAVDALRKRSGDGAEWVVALGTNDARRHSPSRYSELIRMMLDRIGRARRVVWVNVYLPLEPARMMHWNAALATVAAERPGEMFVYDWAAWAAQNPAWLTPDGIHYNADGYQARAFAIAVGARALFDAGFDANRGQGLSNST